MPIGIGMAPSLWQAAFGTLGGLLADAIIPGRDIALTNAVSLGARKSIFTGPSVRAETLVDSALTTANWSVGAAASIVKFADDEYDITWAGGLAIIDFIIPTGTTARNCTCSMKLMDGAFVDGVTKNYLRFINTIPSTVGVGVALNGLTSEYQELSATVDAGTESSCIRFRANQVSAVTIRVKQMRLTETIEISDPFPSDTVKTTTKIDTLTVDALPIVGSVAGAVNKVSTILSDWTILAASESANIITEDGVTAQHKASFGTTVVSGATISFRARQVVGARHLVVYVNNSQGSERVGINLTTGAVFGVFGTPDSTVEQRVDGWTYITVTTYSSGTGGCAIGMSDGVGNGGTNLDAYDGDGSSSIELGLLRSDSLLSSQAAHPAESIENHTYLTDIPYCTPVHPAVGYVAIPFMSYDWSDTGNPVDATPILYEAGAFQITLDASGFYTTNGGAVSTLKPVAGVLSVVLAGWDGVNHWISVDDETPVTNASAVIPSSTAYIGNLVAGTSVSHAALNVLISSGTGSGDETEWNTILQAAFGGLELV